MRGNNFLIPGTYSLAGGTNTCGAMTQWYRDILFSDYLQEEQQGGKNAFARMPEGIEEIAPGSEGLITLPYFAGERTPINDPKARGMIFGLTLSQTFVSLGFGKRWLFRTSAPGSAERPRSSAQEAYGCRRRD